MLARILEDANQEEKFLQKVVRTKCQNFVLHHPDNLSISKDFANLTAINP